jgi:hypothetical protein
MIATPTLPDGSCNTGRKAAAAPKAVVADSAAAIGGEAGGERREVCLEVVRE